MFAEQIVDYIYAYDNLEEPEENSFFNKLKLLEREELIKNEIKEIFHTVRIEGNKGVHESLDSVESAKTLLSLSYKLAVWFMQVYGDWKFEPEEFEFPNKDNNKNLESLENKYDSIIENMQEDIDELKKRKNNYDIKNRKEKSEKVSKKLVFNAEENEMIEINSSDDKIEISSENKFITTDIIDDNKSYYKNTWNSVKRAFSGRQCLAYWRYPLFSKRGENNKEPDIIIIDKELGVIVLEIIDININNILNAQYERWDFKDGSSEEILYNIEDIMYELKGLYQGNRSLRGIKESAAVILPNINKKEWENNNFDSRKIIFQDQLTPKKLLNRIGEVETLEGKKEFNKEAWNDILMSLTGQITHGNKRARKKDEELSKSGSFLGRIFGINNNKKNNQQKKELNRGEIKQTIKSDLYEVDMQQEIIGKTIPPGPQRIRGIAGSGKTVLLAQKAAHMHLKHPDWKIALVFFTRSLYDNVIQEVNKWLKRFSNGEVEYDFEKNDKLQILHAWGAKDQPGFYRKMCEIHGKKPLHAGRKKLIEGAPNEKLVHACKFLLEEVDEIKNIYDAVLIDEAQDLVVDNEDLKFKNKQPFYWLAYKSLKKIDGNKDKRLIWAYDEAQSLNSLNIPTAPELFGKDPHFKRLVSGFHSGGIRKSEIMNKCYRTPGPVLTAAHAMGMGLLRPDGMLRGYTTQEDWENIGYEIKEGSFNPVGQKVVLHRPREMTPNRVPDLWNDDIIKFNNYNTRKEELNNLIEKIKYNINEEGLSPSRDILVIALGDNSEAFKLKVKAAKRLKKEGIDIFIPTALKNNILYPNYPNKDPNKFWNDGAVTFTTTYRAKGNEAYMVYVIGLDKIAEDESNFALRNQLFVALSRTKGWLEVSGIGEFPMYKEFRNVFESGNTFEFTFQRPLAEKRKRKNNSKDRKIKENDVIELKNGKRGKVVTRNKNQLVVKVAKDQTRVVKPDNCTFIREGRQTY